ncbi:MAG TPA: MraY family glycosyltransferase [Terriglobales bacterium]|nr:MraY family glycosyltransferase [Terriglobales bacterium]
MKSLGLTYCVTFVVSLLISFLLTRYLRDQALSRGWKSRQVRDRDVHTTPIPRLGGVAIFLCVVGVVAVLMAFSRFSKALDPHIILSILVPALLIFLLGLYDDLFSVGPWVKFAVQIIAAVAIFLAGFRIIELPILFGNHSLGFAGSLLATVFWVLLITNAFNLVDGLDGLAAGSALFSTLTVVVISLMNGRVMIGLVGLALAGAILGFLRFNFNPATIFLGDCGSLFIGFVLSVLALVGAGKSSTAVAVAIPVVSFGLPILETGISVVRRFLSGQPLFAPDRHHIHHKLLERGWTHRQVVVILYGVSAAFGLLSALLLYPGGPTIGVVLFVIGAGIWMGVQHLNYPEFFELHRIARRTLEQKQIIVNNLAFRRATFRLAKVERLSELGQVLEDTFRGNDFDGFELRSASLARVRTTPFGNRDSDLHLTWGRAGSTFSLPIWTMSLELTMPDSGRHGCLVIYKRYARDALRVDVNLLLQEFRLVLAQALSRALAAETEEQTVSAEALAAAANSSLQ